MSWLKKLILHRPWRLLFCDLIPAVITQSALFLHFRSLECARAPCSLLPHWLVTQPCHLSGDWESSHSHTPAPILYPFFSEILRFNNCRHDTDTLNKYLSAFPIQEEWLSSYCKTLKYSAFLRLQWVWEVVFIFRWFVSFIFNSLSVAKTQT